MGAKPGRFRRELKRNYAYLGADYSGNFFGPVTGSDI